MDPRRLSEIFGSGVRDVGIGGDAVRPEGRMR